MDNDRFSDREMRMAQRCVDCSVCRHARKRQKGPVYWFVRTIENDLCPWCKAYERVYGRKAHEPFPGT